ncbi:MAG: helix-turn-helix domain-containing protein [Clostridia bacterium]|nr:helix-turn-helix domain-containing protein [Clostridia bacterium]
MIHLETTLAQKRYWAHINHPKYIPLHWHQYYEIELVVKGNGTQIINSIEIPLCPGTVTVVSPEDFHRVETEGNDSFEIVNLCVVPDALSEDMIKLLRKNPPPYFFTMGEDEMREFISDHAELAGLEGDYDELTDAICIRKIELVLLRLIKNVLENNSYLTKKSSHSLVSTTLQPVITYINEHYNETLRRKELANIVHLSASYFGDLFKKNLGISVIDYITDVRMRKAYSMLRHTNKPILEIIQAVGFNSPSLFYRKFYEYYKMKPSDIAKG